MLNMPWYDWLLLFGGAATLFATSNAIWEYMVPEKANSPVPLTFWPRLFSLIVGLGILAAGIVGLAKASRIMGL